ncbi:28S ribosomal protein S16, mitochondrial [Bagarius yarrelli]|uniref:Small ribosomal subunit protein bS16m n=1 Tax=Bagarius yarrelli TaxID=175774 RepID=A0A556V4V0_BAGYA|nr:28S ribosomal protein S16, mitochondrial [Bagarius yarrelli]
MKQAISRNLDRRTDKEKLLRNHFSFKKNEIRTMVHLSSLLLRKYHGGHVAIRLALGGATNRPFYRIVAAYNKRARDGKYIEQLGSYDPLPNIYNEKLISFNYDRIKYWLGCGAHPTKPVAKLLGLAGFFPLHPMTVTEAERRKVAAALKQDAINEEKEEEEEKPVEQ